MLQYLSPQYRELTHFPPYAHEAYGANVSHVTLQPQHRRPNDTRHEQQNRDEATPVRVRAFFAHALRRDVQDGPQDERVEQRQQEALGGPYGVTHGQHPW